MGLKCKQCGRGRGNEKCDGTVHRGKKDRPRTGWHLPVLLQLIKKAHFGTVHPHVSPHDEKIEQKRCAMRNAEKCRRAHNNSLARTRHCSVP